MSDQTGPAYDEELHVVGCDKQFPAYGSLGNLCQQKRYGNAAETSCCQRARASLRQAEASLRQAVELLLRCWRTLER